MERESERNRVRTGERETVKNTAEWLKTELSLLHNHPMHTHTHTHCLLCEFVFVCLFSFLLDLPRTELKQSANFDGDLF